MAIQQKDHILRLIEQAAAVPRRLRERLASAADDEPIEAVQQLALLQALDPNSAAAMVRDPERLTLWVELLRVQADAHRRGGDATRADAIETRAAALHATLGARP